MRFPKRFAPKFQLESLEGRDVPATFVVANLNDSGAGSFRQAIIDANSTVGADDIDFNVAGSITLASALPSIIEAVNIDGSSAPGFTNAPVVQIDYNGQAGLVIAAGSKGATLRSLAHVNAAGSGVTVSAPQILIMGNYFGLGLDGSTVLANTGSGLELTQTAIQCTIGSTNPLDRNVISGNGSHGLVINGGFENKAIANFIGTDKTGALDRGNGGNGVLITNAASTNAIGGVTPSAQKFINIAPEGNVISGNALNGILITNGSVSNLVAANFIGTNLVGDTAVGNDADGIAITRGSNANVIRGTFVNEIPFIFMNLVSGNGGNGLRVSDSNDTVVQANVFGLNVTNDGKLANGGSGSLIEGSSSGTVYGGVIPLGNVTSGNNVHGVALTGTVSNTQIFNSFSGTGAFSLNDQIGNKVDGINITATGGNNVVRTTVISANGDDGLEISGAATGVTVVQVLAGTNTNGTSVLANGDNGIEIGGTASGNTIGGVQLQFSVAPHNIIAGNVNNGIAVVGSATNNTINFSYIGSTSDGLTALPNGKAGILLDTGTSNTTVGSVNPLLYTHITGNTGAGIQINSSGNRVVGTNIGLTKTGTSLANGGDGISVAGSNNVIGGDRAGEPNTITASGGNGVNITSGNNNAIAHNSIYSNTLLGIEEAAGTNNDQTSPFVASALQLIDGVQISGAINTTPNAYYTVEFFADTAATAATAEGKSFLGSLEVRADSSGVGRFQFVTALPPAGSTFITATATDSAGNTSEFSTAKAISLAANNLPGNGINGGTITVFPGFDGEVRIVPADFTGDGIMDLAAATGPGSQSLVRVLDGATGNELFSISPFGTAFTGGLFITAGDVNGDSKADLAITAGFFGGPRVRLFQGGSTFTQINDFFGIDDVNFRGGTSAALADINADGKADLAVSAGAGGGPRVAVYNGVTLANAAPTRFKADFFAFDNTLRSGVYVAAGDITGDGKADLVFSSGVGGGPQVRILDGAKYLAATVNANGTITGADAISFFARSSSDRSGIRVAARDLDGDGLFDVTTRADNGSGHDAVTFFGKALNAGTVAPKSGFDAAFDDYSNAIFVGS